MLEENHNFLTCPKAEIKDLTVFIVVYGEKFHQSHAVTLTLIRQCPMSNSSELFSYTTIYSSFKRIEYSIYNYTSGEGIDGNSNSKTINTM